MTKTRPTSALDNLCRPARSEAAGGKVTVSVLTKRTNGKAAAETTGA